MKKKPITLRHQEVWVKQIENDKFQVATGDCTSHAHLSFLDACDTAKIVDEFYSKLQAVQDLLDA